MDVFNPETAVIGGTAVLTIHLTIMAQVRRFIPNRLAGAFDLLNYPLAFLEMLFINPPYPLVDYGEWQAYAGGAIAIAALASVSAKKVLSGKENGKDDTE